MIHAYKRINNRNSAVTNMFLEGIVTTTILTNLVLVAIVKDMSDVLR